MGNFLRFVILPGLFGAFLTLFIFKFLPEWYHLSNNGQAMGSAMKSAFANSFMPYVKMIETGHVELKKLILPLMGFVAMSFGYYLYKSDNINH